MRGSRSEAERGRLVLELSPEMIVLLDDHGRVLAASRRARAILDSRLVLIPVRVVRARNAPGRRGAPGVRQ